MWPVLEEVLTGEVEKHSSTVSIKFVRTLDREALSSRGESRVVYSTYSSEARGREGGWISSEGGTNLVDTALALSGNFLTTLTVLALLALLCGCPQTEDSQPAPASTPLAGAPIDAPPKKMPTGPPGTKVAPTDPAARAALSVEAPKPSEKEGYIGVSFSQLADFPYEVDELGRRLPNTKLPAEIAALDGKQVAVSGYLVPIEYDGDKVSSLILVRNQLLCCYGEEPKLNEWVWVSIDPPVDSVTDIPVTLYGTLEASPDEEEGQVISLYRLLSNEMAVMQ